MLQYRPEFAVYLETGIGMQGNGGMTLGQMLSLLPHTGELRTALEAALTALGRLGVEDTRSE